MEFIAMESQCMKELKAVLFITSTSVELQDLFYNYSQQENIEFMQAGSVLFALTDARLFVDSLLVTFSVCFFWFSFSHAYDAPATVVLV